MSGRPISLATTHSCSCASHALHTPCTIFCHSPRGGQLEGAEADEALGHAAHHCTGLELGVAVVKLGRGVRRGAAVWEIRVRQRHMLIMPSRTLSLPSRCHMPRLACCHPMPRNDQAAHGCCTSLVHRPEHCPHHVAIHLKGEGPKSRVHSATVAHRPERLAQPGGNAAGPSACKSMAA